MKKLLIVLACLVGLFVVAGVLGGQERRAQEQEARQEMEAMTPKQIDAKLATGVKMSSRLLLALVGDLEDLGNGALSEADFREKVTRHTDAARNIADELEGLAEGKGFGDYVAAADNVVSTVWSACYGIGKYLDGENEKGLSEAEINIQAVPELLGSTQAARLAYLTAAGFTEQEIVEITEACPLMDPVE